MRLFLESDFKKLFFEVLFIYLLLKKLIYKKYFFIKEIFNLIFRKVFFFISSGKYFLEVMKNLKISYYLLNISNLVLKLLIVIYFV